MTRPDTFDSVGFVLRPTVALATPWVYVCAHWFMGILLTAKFTVRGTPEHAAEGDLSGLLSLPALLVFSVVNVLFLAALAIEARTAWRLPSWARRPQLAGVLLCAVNVALLQWGALLAHDPLASR